LSSVFVQNPVEVTVSLATQATEVESFGVPLFIVPHNVYSDTRKPYLTLKHLNKLKKIRQLRYREKQQQLKNIELVYGNKEEV
jgi:hypothetical protein